MLDRFRIGGNKTIPNSVMWTLTERGSKEAEQYGGRARDKVLNSLQENGSSTISDICNDTGLKRTTVEILIKILRRGGMVVSVKGEES